MGMIQVDFLSVTIGYVVGVLLMWSLCTMFYGESDDGQTNSNTENLYSSFRDGNRDVYVCSSDRRIM